MAANKALKNALYTFITAIVVMIFCNVFIGNLEFFGIPFNINFRDYPMSFLLYISRTAAIVAAVVGAVTWIQQSFAALRQETAALRQQVKDLEEELKKDE